MKNKKQSKTELQEQFLAISHFIASYYNHHSVLPVLKKTKVLFPLPFILNYIKLTKIEYYIIKKIFYDNQY